MSDGAELERSYHRLLRWFPKDFRLEYEREMVDLLMTAAGGARRRPRFTERVNLMANGLWARMRPTLPRSAHTVLAAVRLMYVGAALETVAMIVFFCTEGQIRASIFHGNPHLTAARWDITAQAELLGKATAGIVAIGVWLVLAWAVGRGHDWARRLSAVMFCLFSLGLLFDVLQGAVVYAPAALAVNAVLWLVGLAAAILLFHRSSEPFFQKHANRIRADGPSGHKRTWVA
jgi:hypothetical protein